MFSDRCANEHLTHGGFVCPRFPLVGTEPSIVNGRGLDRLEHETRTPTHPKCGYSAISSY